ncbi:MAG: hypothetical protein KatS3mg038_1035 [Candidatus Kapaibacterium sp.]|nr:MAG: hypothetical protein KatS3mg038_1035 [Candidatus Kapabacteria bacterium]
MPGNRVSRPSLKGPSSRLSGNPPKPPAAQAMPFRRPRDLPDWHTVSADCTIRLRSPIRVLLQNVDLVGYPPDPVRSFGPIAARLPGKYGLNKGEFEIVFMFRNPVRRRDEFAVFLVSMPSQRAEYIGDRPGGW